MPIPTIVNDLADLVAAMAEVISDCAWELELVDADADDAAPRNTAADRRTATAQRDRDDITTFQDLERTSVAAVARHTRRESFR
jgi:hypothetical protein